MKEDDAITQADLSKTLQAQTDEITGLMREFMQQTSDEFQTVHIEFEKVNTEIRTNREVVNANREDIKTILASLDHIEKQLEIDGDERAVLSHQLQRLHDWTVEAGKRIGLEFDSH